MYYDAIIIGGGPAGLSAGIYAARAGKAVVIVESNAIGGQIMLSHEIENYPGVAATSGFALTELMRRQAENFGAQFVYDEIVEAELNGDVKRIVTKYSGELTAKSVVIASGAKNKPLGIERESELIGRGISYCATCDGNFFKKKTVAVCGGGDTALTDAVYLAGIAETVYIIHRRAEYRGSKILVDRMRKLGVRELLSSRVTALNGTPLQSIKVENVDTKEKSVIAVNGLFVAVGLEPQSALFTAEKENGYIVTDENMKTSIDGVFAVGDVRKKLLRQVITACADGAIAGSQV